MSSAFWKSVFVSPIVLSITLLLSTGAIAAPKSNEIGRSSTGTASDLILNKASGATQVKVAQTTPAASEESSEVASETVKPSDWSYKALQDVATKYGCNANLNNQPVSQLEFARGLNACLNKNRAAPRSKPQHRSPPHQQPPLVLLVLLSLKRIWKLSRD